MTSRYLGLRVYADKWVILQEIKFAVHAHPTLSEVLDELFKSAKVRRSQNFLFKRMWTRKWFY